MVDLQACLDTLSEVIVSQQNEGAKHEPTPSEYFAVILMTLSSRIEEDRLPLFLQIMAGVIPNTSSSLLQSQYRAFSKVMINILNLTDSPTIRSLVLTCISRVLLHQETSDGFWNQVQALQTINALLSYIDDDNAAVRKAAVTGIVELLALHHGKHYSTIRSYFADFSIGVMKACSRASYRRALCVVIILESVLVYMPEQVIKKVVDTSFKLQSTEIPKLTAAVFRMLDSTFQHPSYKYALNATSSLINTVLTHRPTLSDVESNCFYLNTLASASIILFKLDSAAAFEVLPKVLELLVQGCEAEFTQVHCAACMSLKRVMQHFLMNQPLSSITIPANLLPEPISSVSAIPRNKLLNAGRVYWDILQALDKMLQLRMQLSWTYVLDAVRGFMICVRGHSQAVHMIAGLVSKVGELVQGVVMQTLPVDTSLHPSLLDTLSVALSCIGLASFLSFTPVIDKVVTKGDLVNQLQSREWVIELLHEELKHVHITKLADFVLHLLPIAGKFHKLTQDATMNLNEVQCKILRNRVTQIWSLLPELCMTKPIDLTNSFPKMQTIFKQALEDEDYPEIAFAASLSLGRLAGHVNSSEPKYPQEVLVFSEHASFYIPLLLSYIETLHYGEGKFKETVQTISQWIAVAPPALCSQICTKLLKLVLRSTTNMSMANDTLDHAAIYMSILLATIPALQGNMVDLVFKTIRPLLTVDEHLSLQKSSYALLNSLIAHHMSHLLQHESALELLKLLSESLLTSHISSRNMRLKCMISVLKTLPADDMLVACEMIVQEVLTCQKDANKKCRDHAVEILNIFSVHLPSLDFFKRLCNYLSAESTSLCASALLAISKLMITQHKIHWDRKNLEPVKGGRKRGRREVEEDEEEIEDDEEEEEEDESDDDAEKNVDAEEDEDGANCEREHSMSVPNTNANANFSHYEELQRMSISLLPSVSLLLSQHNAEQTKACLKFLKTVAGVLNDSVLAQSAQQIITSTCTELGGLRDKFTTQIRNILRKLFRKLGSEVVKNMVPEQDMPLLDYIARMNRKDLKKKMLKAHNAAAMTGESDDESDEEEGVENNEVEKTEDYRLAGKKVKGQRAQAKGLESLLPSVLDQLLQNNVQGSSLKKHRIEVLDGKVEEEKDEQYEVKVVDGKVLIKQKEKPKEEKKEDGKKVPEVVKEKPDFGYKKRRGNTALQLKEPGAEYRAKNAGGDVWKKNQTVQPHAYIPLDPRLLSKKHHAQAVQHFAVVADSNKRNKEIAKRKKVKVPGRKK